MTIALRPLEPSDVPSWAALLAAAEEVDRTGEHYNEADLHEELADPNLEVGRDVIAAVDPDRSDEVLGYVVVRARAGTADRLRVDVEGRVRPDRRGEGIGTVLAESMIARAQAVHAERAPALPLVVTAAGMSHDSAQADLLERVGLRPHRWSFGMRVPLDRQVPQVRMPEGYRVLTYSTELDTATFDAHNEAFRDHPGFVTWSPSEWQQWVTGSRNFRPEVTFLVTTAEEPERVVAYVQTSEFDAYQAATGHREAYVARVGTRPEHRGRGLAGALLAHSLQAYRDAGYDEASLDVDSTNPTGALGLYEKAGFVVERRMTSYEGAIGDC